MALAYDFNVSRQVAERQPPHRLVLEPVRVGGFTTDTSSSSSPGDASLFLGLIGVRQTSNAIAWQDDEFVRCEILRHASVWLEALSPEPALPRVNREAARENLFELRRLTDFTWEELAQLADVDRRTLHNWTQGGFVREANRARLADLLQAMRYIDRGTVEGNRLALNNPDLLGRTALDLIKHGRYEEARAIAGSGGSRRPQPGFPDRAHALRYGALGMGYFSDPAHPIDAGAVAQPPAQLTRSRRMKLKRD